MPNKPDSLFSFRAVDLARLYDASHGRSHRHQAAKVALERYHFLLKEALPQLTEAEAIALWSALNGANTSHTETLPALQQSTAGELLEDGMTELALKVKGWTPTQWIAAVDACDRVGNEQYRIVDLPAELTRAGLIAP